LDRGISFAPGALTARSPRVDALAGGSVVAGRRQGAAGELVGATGRPSGKEGLAGLTEDGGRLRGGANGFGRRRSPAVGELW
jgi:hypothetical protein